MPTQPLKQAIDALNAGRRSEARELLTQILAADQRDVDALLWMAAASDTVDERRKWLLRVYEIDPNNPYALKGLVALDATGGQPPQLSQTDQTTVVSNTEASPEELHAVGQPSQKATSRKSNILYIYLAAAVVAVLVVLFALVLVSVYTSGRNNSSGSGTPAQNAYSLLPGDTGHLYKTGGDQYVFVAVDETAMAEFAKYTAAQDDIGVAKMALEGALFPVENGEQVKILSINNGYWQVRVVGGQSDGRAGWTFAESLRR